MTKTEPQGMTAQEMMNKSSAKVKQVNDLMTLLHIRVEARERITDQGFIEKLVFWIDDEKYPQAPAKVEGPEGAEAPETDAKVEPKAEEETAPVDPAIAPDEPAEENV